MTVTNADTGVLHAPIFEGSEKRIEIDFRATAAAPADGLRAIPRETLDELMTLAHCCIVSSRRNAALDAYVLSESSLFVYPTKWILKTCGTTRLLNSVPRLLEVAAALGLEPRRVKYTRASFLFPDNQVRLTRASAAECMCVVSEAAHLRVGLQRRVLTT
jgi:S-adenosylmethionine decarboxylase proenzyme